MDSAASEMIFLGVIIVAVVAIVIIKAITAQRKIDEEKEQQKTIKEIQKRSSYSQPRAAVKDYSNAPKPKPDHIPKNHSETGRTVASNTNTSEPSGDISYITSKGVTPQMIYDMHVRKYNSDGRETMFFPNKLGDRVFVKKFSKTQVCIITTERPDFRKIKLGEVVLLVPEPTNHHDRNAVLILSRSQKIGYLYRNGFQDIINEKFREGEIVVGSIVAKEAKNNLLEIETAVYK